MEHILSLDLGTTAFKVALFDSAGGLVAKATREYQLKTPTALAVELPVEEYWRAFKAGLAEVLATSAADPESIAAFGLSAQGETLIFADERGCALRDAIVWMDNRAQGEAAELQARFGDRVYRVTGQVSVVPTWPAAKVLWIRRHEPETFAKTRKILLIEDYFIMRLTGRCVAEGSLLCSTVYWDINTKRYWREMLDYLGVGEAMLPEVRESGEKVGGILPEVAAELGLSPRTVVCTGALDQAAGAIGVGNIKPGVFSENTGAALAICASTPSIVIDPKGRMPCHYHGVADTYMAHTFTTGGMVLRWFRDAFCGEEMAVAARTGQDSYDLIGRMAETVPAGCEGLVMLPHLAGAMAPEANPGAKGVFHGVTLAHRKPHFARAIMEAIAFIVRRNIEVVEDMGIAVDEVRALGGGARSAAWNRIKADATGKTYVTTAAQEAACLGAALVAGAGVGLFGSVAEAAAGMIKVKDRFEPDAARKAVYDEAFDRYVRLYEASVPLFGR